MLFTFFVKSNKKISKGFVLNLFTLFIKSSFGRSICWTSKITIKFFFYTNFIASVSKTSAKTFRDKIKSLEIHKKTGCKINMIAEILNPMLRGWMNYFGKFNPSAMKYTLQCIERRIVKWAMCKYKNLRGHRRRAEKWLLSVRKREPKLFAHWSKMYSYC